jgi:uncharacterized protein (DUF736 family)
MTDNLINFIRIEGNKITGNIATLTFDIDVTGEAYESDNEKAPVFRLYAKTPRGRSIQIGGIWQRLNSKDEPYYTLTVDTGHARFYANLGKYPGQDDDTIYAVIPNDYLNGERRA